MAAHADGELRKTGDLHCAKCGEKVHVETDDRIPKRQDTESEARRDEPGN